MKKHIENLQGKLLIEIYKRYSSRSGTSLNGFIKKTLKESDGDLELTKNIKADLEELEGKEILTWKAEPMEKKGGNFPESQKYRSLLGTETDPKYRTFKEIFVEVKLTADKGFDHAANYAISQASLSNNSWIRTLTIGLLIVTAGGVMVQMRQCSISKQLSEKAQPNANKNSKIPGGPTTDTIPLVPSRDKEHFFNRVYLSKSEAERILGEKAFLSDSSSTIKKDTLEYKRAYTAHTKDPKTGKTGVLYFMIEQYKNNSSAKNAYDFIKTANQNHEGVKTVHDMGDEAYFHSDGKNFYFILVRKGKLMFRMKVNKITSHSSLNDFNLVAKDISDKL